LPLTAVVIAGSQRLPAIVIARSEATRQSPTPMNQQYFVYILTNLRNTVLYTGVTNDLLRGVYEHREKLIPGFTEKYNVSKLVFYEAATDVRASIAREKQIKAGSRSKKIVLIEGMNPKWQDLYQALV
jgi:putative endonuclease